MSGRVRDAFKALGHDAWSCDILPTLQPGNHIQGDALEVVRWGWDLMIAHPPCTYLSNAGARHLYPKGQLNTARLDQGMVARDFFMSLWLAPIERICIENPTPSKVFDLPPCGQVIQPWEYGHPYSKKTCLWLKGLPPLMATDIVGRTESTKVAGNWFNKGGKDRQVNRSVTFQGIADAMASQWG
jgi:hypothetical protein